MIARTLAAAGALALASATLAGCGADADHGADEAPAATQAALTGPAQLERGRYLVAIMDCTGCHTPGSLMGKPDMQRALAGADVGFEAPGLGVVYPPNLTPHPGADISRWSEAEIVRAMRTGERPDGRILVPIMPWKAYAALTDADAAALAAYLKSLQPIAAPVLRQTSTERAPAPYLTLKVPPGSAAGTAAAAPAPGAQRAAAAGG